jgi:hypothetical protein
MTDTLGNLIAGAKSEVAGRLDGTIQPREVEYEWRVRTERSYSPLCGEEWAREVLHTWRRGGEDAWLERRPVGEWERVDG